MLYMMALSKSNAVSSGVRVTGKLERLLHYRSVCINITTHGPSR